MCARSLLREYAITLDRDARLAIPAGSVLDAAGDWTPEHLLLAALARCTVASLGFHAARAGAAVTAAGAAEARVTRRDTDRRYAMSAAEVVIDVTVAPAPASGDLERLLARAEHDCFVGASLAAAPRYRWTVNGVAQSEHT
jgi:organic hydroperoxide reductase OsmC/OhrA